MGEFVKSTGKNTMWIQSFRALYSGLQRNINVETVRYPRLETEDPNVQKDQFDVLHVRTN
jgi:hypothetical protein